MKIYFIEDKNGTFVGEGGNRRFTRLCGKVAYDYLQTEAGKSKRFMKTTSEEDGGDEIYIELPKEMIPQFRVDERREQYVADSINGSGFITISLYACEGKGEDGDTVSGEELIEDGESSIEEEILERERIEQLHKALQTLSEAEMALVTALFLQDEPMTEREYSACSGIPQKTINDRKSRILIKLKKYF